MDAFIARLESLLYLAQMPPSRANCGVKPSQIKILATEAAKQWTAGFNPRSITEKDFAKLCEAAFEPRGKGNLT